MTLDHAPTLMTTVDDLLDARQAALAEYDNALRSLAIAQQHLAAAGFAQYAVGSSMRDYSCYAIENAGERTKQVDKLRRTIDRSLWEHLGNKTGLLAVMDTQTRKKWRDDIQKHAPECTRDALEATFSSLYGQRGLIFEQGLVNAFAHLSSHYKTNDAFKIGPKIIVTHCGGLHARGIDELVDAERVLYVLDGKTPPAHDKDGIRAVIRAANPCSWREGQTFEFESEYLRGRVYRNNNAHVWFKDDTLRDRANRIIAKHYGETLPDDRTTA